MPKISTPLAVSLIICSFITGLAGGFYFTPEYRDVMYEKQSMNLGPADRLVDLRYLNQMIAHHQVALDLAKQAAASANHPEIKALAADIQKGEPTLIVKLYDYKKQFYSDSRPAPKNPVPQLGSVDSTYDLRFLNALIYHHESGIEMTRDIRTKSTRSEIINDANAVQNFLETSLTTLKEWRQTWYGI